MGILGNMAKNTAKEYAELLCKGVAGLGLLAFSQITYTAIEGSRKAAKNGFIKFADTVDKISELPTAEERKQMKEEKAKEEKARKLEETYADMKRRQKESMERGGR